MFRILFPRIITPRLGPHIRFCFRGSQPLFGPCNYFSGLHCHPSGTCFRTLFPRFTTPHFGPCLYPGDVETNTPFRTYGHRTLPGLIKPRMFVYGHRSLPGLIKPRMLVYGHRSLPRLIKSRICIYLLTCTPYSAYVHLIAHMYTL
jgi:hypothetical protein